MAAKPSAALPVVPPAPKGERVQPKARGLATLIAGLESAVIYHGSEQLVVMVLVVSGRVTDAIAEGPNGVVKGIEVLDELADVEVDKLEVTRVEPSVARVLSTYWRAKGAAREVVQSFIKPGRRGVIAITAPSGTGVLFFDENGIVAGYRDGEHKPGRDALDGLLDDPDVVLSVRADAMPAGPPPSDNGRQQVATPSPVAPPVPEAPPSPAQPPPSPPTPPPGPPPKPQAAPPPAPSPTAVADPRAQAQLEGRRQAIVEMVRARLGRLAGPVEQLFQPAQSIEELVAASDRVRAMQLRMVNPLTLQGISEDAGAIARGEPPKR
jgi:hypothetical protein